MRVCKWLAYVNLYLFCGISLKPCCACRSCCLHQALGGQEGDSKQEVEELWHKLEVFEQCCIDVEAKLVEGALTSARHAISILKSYLPGLDVGLISQGYNCDGGKAGELFDESQATLESFVEKLNLSVSDEEEEEWKHLPVPATLWNVL